MTEIDEVMRRVHALGADHSLDGWPAVQMRDLVLMHHEIRDLRAQLRTQKKGVLAVIKASVELVCSPAWAGVSDEDVALEQALRDAGFVTPNDLGNRRDAGPIGGASVLTDGLGGR